MSEQERRTLQRKAKNRVMARKGFYIHFGIYAIFSFFLFAINLLTDPADYWFYYPVLSWGVAIAVHYLVTFGIPGSDILSQEWEQRELEKEMYILQRKKQLEDGKDTFLDRDGEEPGELELRDPVRLKRNWDDDLV